MSTKTHPDEGRIRRVTSDDGTEIAGRVHGDGPPIVFVHGGLTDGDFAWAEMLPHVTDRFTCYLPSMRGAGLSDDHDDMRPERHVEDLVAFIDSIDEQVGLIGHSGGGTIAFGAVQRGANVAAMAAYEPAVFEFWEEGADAERYQKAIISMGEAAAEGRMTDGARDLLSVFANDEELARMEEEGIFEHAGQYVPQLLQIFEQAPRTEAPNPNDPSELSTVSIPVLLLYGSETTTAHTDSVYYLNEQLPNCQMREIAGSGHMAPALGSEAVATAFVEFFDDQLSQAPSNSMPE